MNDGFGQGRPAGRRCCGGGRGAVDQGGGGVKFRQSLQGHGQRDGRAGDPAPRQPLTQALDGAADPLGGRRFIHAQRGGGFGDALSLQVSQRHRLAVNGL